MSTLLPEALFYCRTLQAEYDRLRTQQEHNNNERNLQTLSDEFTNHDAEMIAEAKLLRQHKGRLEARMRILEDHNRQLEAQLQRLRILLEQVSSVVKYENSKPNTLVENIQSQNSFYAIKHYRNIFHL